MKKSIWLSKVSKAKIQLWTPNTFILIYSSLILIALSGIAYTFNACVYHYPGNNYFPPATPLTALILILLNVGMTVMYGPLSTACRISRELFLFFSIMALVAFATNAVQYTPFSPIDARILAWQTAFPWSMDQLMAVPQKLPFLKALLSFNYASLDYQMALLPIMMMILKRYNEVHDYYQHLILTALLGFTCYYFFPTTAPASLIKLPYFNDAQYATGLKFNQIHQYLAPTTIEGGLIAFPSFHTIWAILCVLLVRRIPILFIPLLINNTLLICACVLLGWHYVLDIVGGVAFVLLSYFTLPKNFNSTITIFQDDVSSSI